MGKHSNLSIVVTGGASGIGAAVCKSLYEQGAAIGIIDIDVNAGESLCEALGDRAFFLLEMLAQKIRCKQLSLNWSLSCLQLMAV